MDFSKLTSGELDDFLFINGIDTEGSAAEKIVMAGDLYGRNDPDTKYTIPVVDLHLATNLIKSSNKKKI